jgi:hypothetical protein
VAEGLAHTCLLLLALYPFAMFAADIASDCVENALVAVLPGDFALLLQFKEEENGMCLDIPERLSRPECEGDLLLDKTQTPTFGYPQGGTRNLQQLLKPFVVLDGASARCSSHYQ